MNRRHRRLGNVEPRRVNGQIATRTEFYKTELFNQIKGIFEVEKPDDWPLDYILNLLIHSGYVIIADTHAGVIPIKGSPYGYNFWDYPTKVRVTAPILNSFSRKLGETAEIVYLERTRYRNYYSFNRLVDIYAYKLAAVDAAIDMNLFNSRLAYIVEAESKGQAETIKSIYEDISEGNPLVVYRSDAISKNGFQVSFNNLKQNYIADQLQDSKRTIMNEFLTLIGINNANTDKRERLIVNEVEANNIELACNIAEWKANLELTCAKVNELFPRINFNIRLRFDPMKIKESSTVEQEGVDKNEST